MKVLVVGSGAREHSIATKLRASGVDATICIYAGNKGALREFAEFDPGPNLHSSDLAKSIAQAGFDLVVIGPENYLADGLSDELKSLGVLSFGPSRSGAELESSKSFSKEIMKAAGIPTAEATLHTTLAEVELSANRLIEKSGMAVIKASGLAGGKGVFVCHSVEDVLEATLRLKSPDFKKASEEILVEEGLIGREVSFFCTLGAAGAIPIGFSVDFKRLSDGDKGPNTGGMGAYSPVPWLPDDAGEQVLEAVVEPLQAELRRRKIDYIGWLYVGIMWGSEGPKVIEFNVRLGDPEAQVLALADESDWLSIILSQLGKGAPPSAMPVLSPAVCVVATSSDYPYREGEFFSEKITIDESKTDEMKVFYASVRDDDDGDLATNSGRVFSVVSKGNTISQARESTYRYLTKLTEGMQYIRWRSDIAQKATDEESKS